jgi:hypothetical protein
MNFALAKTGSTLTIARELKAGGKVTKFRVCTDCTSGGNL